MDEALNEHMREYAAERHKQDFYPPLATEDEEAAAQMGRRAILMGAQTVLYRMSGPSGAMLLAWAFPTLSDEQLDKALIEGLRRAALDLTAGAEETTRFMQDQEEGRESEGHDPNIPSGAVMERDPRENEALGLDDD